MVTRGERHCVSGELGGAVSAGAGGGQAEKGRKAS